MAFAGHSIKYRFMLLIVLVAMPIAFFDVYHENQEMQRSTIKVSEDLMRSTDTVVGKVQDIIESSHDLLVGLAVVDQISGGDRQACSRLLHKVGVRYSKYTNFSVVNQDKYIICSSGPLPKPVHVANSPNINEAFATKAFAISPFKFGVLSGKPILVFSEPLLDQNNKVVGAINNGLSLTWLGEYFASVVTLTDEHIVVFDDKGVVLASYPEGHFQEGSVVKDASLIELVGQQGSGTGNFTHRDNIEMMAAYGGIPNIPGGAHVVSFASLDVLQSDMLVNLYRRLAVISLLTILSLILVWGGVRVLLLNPIDRLVASAEALAQGNLKVRSDVANETSELGRLGLAFDQMAEALAARTEAVEETKQALRQSEAKLRAIFQSTNVTALISTDAMGNLVTWNPGAEKIFGYSEKEILGQPVSRLVPEQFKEAHNAGLNRAANTRVYHIIGKTVEMTGLHKDGREFPLTLSLGVWDVGAQKYFSAVINDITERKQAEKKIHQLAYTDPYTGMPNEAFFLERLNENIDQNNQGFVASVELSGIGDIIGTFGLEAAELIIYQTGKRLREQLNSQSVVARTGERLFKIVFISNDPSEVVHLAAIANRFFQIACDSFELMGSSVFVNVSMGVSIIDPRESTAKSILTDVEISHHEAKNSITSSLVFFEKSIKKQLVRSTQIVARLHSAIENKEFQLYYQPQFNLKTNTIIGCEALIRWPEKTQGWISPAEFIPIAEKSGRIEEITTWTVDEASRAAASWIAETGLKLRVGVNISAEELDSQEFLHYVTKFIETSKLPPELLEIEITETAIMKDVAMATSNLRKIHDMGISIAIDDFGTGQASLAYLKNFPINRLKIDQSFVKSALTNKTDQHIIASIVNLAHLLDMEVIAEGVEVEEHIALLVALGCDDVQGFYLARPMPEDQFVKFVKSF